MAGSRLSTSAPEEDPLSPSASASSTSSSDLEVSHLTYPSVTHFRKSASPTRDSHLIAQHTTPQSRISHSDMEWPTRTTTESGAKLVRKSGKAPPPSWKRSYMDWKVSTTRNKLLSEKRRSFWQTDMRLIVWTIWSKSNAALVLKVKEKRSLSALNRSRRRKAETCHMELELASGQPWLMKLIGLR